ncbi:hypothetical protein LJD53_001186 [Acinetobacter baumannii]|nr:hypothetical protein [Acinetobacter baumannii]
MTDLNKERELYMAAKARIEKEEFFCRDWDLRKACAELKQAEINELRAELKKAKAKAVPEGYVLVPKEPTEKFKEDLKQHLDELWWGDHGCDWDGFVSVNGIDPLKIYALAIEASESGAEG